jgi:hypothetical protein
MFQREDWTDFRSIEGLCRKAGCCPEELPATIIRELTDNALDAAGDCTARANSKTIIVTDEGDGIPGADDQIAELFSLNRGRRSSKYLRVPTRGALGNGLRVISGSVAATGGELLVSTRGRTLRIDVDPSTGHSQATRIGSWKGDGTSIKVALGAGLSVTPNDRVQADIAIEAARAQGQNRYRGKSSPHWYSAAAFFELTASVQDDVMVRDFIGWFEGCSRSVSEIAGNLGRRPVRSLTPDEADQLLARAKLGSRPVDPRRLGAIGSGAFDATGYAKLAYEIRLGTGERLPMVIECWATASKETRATFLINGTAPPMDAHAFYQGKERSIYIYAPGDLGFEVKSTIGMRLHICLTTPFVLLVSDGKSPALGAYEKRIEEMVTKAVRRAKLAHNKAKGPTVSQKSVCFAHMDEAIRDVSSDRQYRFHYRQCFYRLRPIVQEETGSELQWENFSKIVELYAVEFGEEVMSYKDPRGSLFIPHTHERIPLGTLNVEKFDRPQWRFNKLLFIEKEGFHEALIEVGWPDRHDVTLITSKGQPTDAVHVAICRIGLTGEPVQILALHDADCAGSKMIEVLRDEARSRAGDSIEIIDLGLGLEEAVELAQQGIVEIEDVRYEKVQPVGSHVSDDWAHWLQTHRVELNVFTTAQFIDWLDEKMAEHGNGRLIPPDTVLSRALTDDVREELHQRITEKILAEADLGGQVETELEKIKPQIEQRAESLAEQVADELDEEPQQAWSNVVKNAAMSVLDDEEVP